MNSPTTTEEQRMTVTVAASELHALLAATIPFAGRDDTLPMLQALRIEVGNGVITATATDRYSLGHARKKATGELAEPVLLPVDQAERLLPELVSRKDSELVELSVTPSHLGDLLNIHLADMDLRITQASHAREYPDLTALLDPAGYEKVGIDGVVQLAPRLLARVHTAVGELGYGAEKARLYFRGQGQPLRVEIEDWFAALLMPMLHRPSYDPPLPAVPAVPYALPDAPADLPTVTTLPLTVDDITYPKTPAEATAGRMARCMAAATHEATQRVFDEPWPKLPPHDQRNDEHRRQARAHMDLMSNAVHTYGLAYLLRQFAAVAPAAADRAAQDLWMAWDAGDSLGEWAYEWLKEYGVDASQPLPHQGWPGALRAAEELVTGG